MTGEIQRNISGWTVDTYSVHNEALRNAQDKFDAERDRRYSELAIEKEKALKIKQTADLAALGLAREIQTYKDEKANQLREQIGQERGTYATKSDLHAAVGKIEESLKPLQEFISSQRGRVGGTDNVWKYIFATVATISAVIAIIAFFTRMPLSTPQIVYIPTPAAVTK